MHCMSNVDIARDLSKFCIRKSIKRGRAGAVRGVFVPLSDELSADVC